ncbi:hypothetical protein ACMFMG_010785 [Clarireedia jacksonii]
MSYPLAWDNGLSRAILLRGWNVYKINSFTLKEEISHHSTASESSPTKPLVIHSFNMYSLLVTASLIAATLACPGHEIPSRHGKRADAPTAEWAYDASYNWAMINPAFTSPSSNTSNITTHPSFTYDNTTLFLQSWHIHAPANHGGISRDRSKAEPHADSASIARAVLGFPIDPFPFNNTSTVPPGSPR